MNILFVTPYYVSRQKASADGFITYLHRITQGLLALGHRPIILECAGKNDRWMESGIEIIQIKSNYPKCINQNIAWIIDSFKKSYKLNRAIKKLYSEIKIDIIQFASTGGVALLYYGKTPAVMRLSLYSKDYFFVDEIFSKRHMRVMAGFERCASKRCNAIYAPSNAIADAFAQDVKRKVYIIKTPYVENVISYDDYYANRYLQGKKYALFFGVLALRKGIEIIGKCLEQFLKTNDQYYFVFVGREFTYNGETTSKMLERCAGAYGNRVIIHPELPQTQLYPIIQKSDFVVLPSLRDNFPNACIEAMYLEKVVIGTDGTGFEQLIEHEVSGLLCRCGDSDDLLEKMQAVVSLSEERKRQMGYNAKKRVERLRPEKVGKELLSLYSHVIEVSKKKKCGKNK